VKFDSGRHELGELGEQLVGRRRTVIGAMPETLRALPGCRTRSETLALLTSIVSYFVCERCGHRWQWSRVSGNAEMRADTDNRVEPGRLVLSSM